jgi:hypothetical protein
VGDRDVKRHDGGEVQPASPIVLRCPSGKADLTVLRQDGTANVQIFVFKAGYNFAVIFALNRKNSYVFMTVWPAVDARLKSSGQSSKVTQWI